MKYLALFVLLIAITACAQNSGTTTPTRTQDDTGAPTAEKPINEPVSPPLLERKADPNVAKLFERSGSVKSYQFDIYDYAQKKSEGTYYIKGDKAKLKLLLTDTTQKNEPDYVYFDLKAKTARAYCLNDKRCEPVMGWNVEYTKYMVTLPPEWIDGMKYGTNTKSLTFYSRLAQVVQYETDGKWYEGYLDNYFGMPMRVAIATDKEMTDIVGGYEYRSIAFNSLSDSDVTAPVV